GKVADIVVASGEPFGAKTKVLEIWIDGKRYEVPEKKSPSFAKASEGKAGSDSSSEARSAKEETDIRPWPGREDAPVATPKAGIVRGATIWSEGPAGILENADLVVADGRIVAVGKGLSAPAGAVEVDGRGKHVTPGIIDSHSHTAVDGQVNEFTHSVTAEVR